MINIKYFIFTVFVCFSISFTSKKALSDNEPPCSVRCLPNESIDLQKCTCISEEETKRRDIAMRHCSFYPLMTFGNSEKEISKFFADLDNLACSGDKTTKQLAVKLKTRLQQIQNKEKQENEALNKKYKNEMQRTCQIRCPKNNMVDLQTCTCIESLSNEEAVPPTGNGAIE